MFEKPLESIDATYIISAHLEVDDSSGAPEIKVYFDPEFTAEKIWEAVHENGEIPIVKVFDEVSASGQPNYMFMFVKIVSLSSGTFEVSGDALSVGTSISASGTVNPSDRIILNVTLRHLTFD